MKKENEEGKLYLVSTPIGNLGDITYRAIEVLNMVDLIIAEDTRESKKLLQHFDIKKEMLSYHKYNEKERTPQLIDVLAKGKSIAMISDAGTPGISDPGEILVKEAINVNIQIIPVPGATALIPALINSGMDTSKFVFEGFIPINKKERKERLQFLKDEKRTIIIYEAPHKLKNTLSDMYDFFENRNICLCRELTKIYEEYKRMTILDAISYYTQNEPRGEFVIVVEGNKSIPEKVEYTNEDISQMFKDNIETGLSKNTAMRDISRKTGISKNEIYKIVMLGEENK